MICVVSVEVSEDLSTDVLSTSLFVVHDSLVGGEDKFSILTGWENGVAEVLEVLELKIEVWRDNTALVESSVQVDDDLASTGIINNLEFSNVSVGLHDFQEFDEGLGDWSEDNL